MSDWQAGDLVWAKYTGWPWWPAVVSEAKCKEPGSLMRVVFIDRKPLYAWIKIELVVDFHMLQ